MKLLTVVGARPQFVKLSAVAREIRRIRPTFPEVQSVVVHTGQHHDQNMSKIFFDELEIEQPQHSLGIAGGSHGEMTGRMLAGIEAVMQLERPDWVVLYGDTNSTLAGALGASKLHVPIAHIEAGLRSYNRRMPEEVNRLLSDHVSTLLFCPTEQSAQNLAKEGISQGVSVVGDVMFDVALSLAGRARSQTSIFAKLKLEERNYVLATVHRAENTDSPTRLKSICDALNRISKDTRVILPLHPRTQKIIGQLGFGPFDKGVTVTQPLGLLEMMRLEQSAGSILTDSGGVQKEAFFFKVPCITMRDETEWVETVHTGWNTLVGADSERILSATRAAFAPAEWPPLYGDGNAAQRIVEALLHSRMP